MTTGTTSTTMRRIGWALDIVVALILFMSAFMKVSHNAGFIANWTGKAGFTEGLATPIGIVEMSCAVLLLVPRTSVLGAILVAAYLGGATCSHVRIGDPAFIAPVLIGMLAWLGLFLRDARIRALVPLRSPE